MLYSLRAKTAALALAVVLTGCTTNVGQKEAFGTLGGAALGGWAGSQIGDGRGQLAAVGAGTLAGALIGREIGVSLDRADRLYMQRTTHQALEYRPSGHTVAWHNPQSGHGGQITPHRAYQRYDGHYCREFQNEIWVGGRLERGYGTACRGPDGSWRIQ